MSLYRTLQLALPLILSNILVPLLGVIDTVVVGHLATNTDLAAVGLGTMLFNALYWLFGFLRMSTTGLVAQAKGRYDILKIQVILAQGLLIAMLLGLLLIVCQYPLGMLIFSWIPAHASVLLHTKMFYRVTIWSAPAEFITYIVLGWMIGEQRVRETVWVVASTTIMAMLLDVIFVWYAGLGATGVAMAYLIGIYTGAMVGCYKLQKIVRLSRCHFCWRYLWQSQRLKCWFVLNGNIFIRTFALLFAFSFFTTQSAHLGGIVLSANVILMNLQGVLAFTLDGFANVAEALVGECIGQRSWSNLKIVLKNTLLCSLIVALAFVLLYGTMGWHFIQLVTTIPAVRVAAHHYLPWLVLLPVIAVWSYWLDGVFIGATRTVALRNSMVVSLIGFLFCWLETRSWGNHGLWLSLTIFLLLRGLTLMSALIYWLKCVFAEASVLPPPREVRSQQ